MSKDFTVIPPKTDIDPITTIEKGENHIRIKMGYTQATFDELTRKANEALDAALMDRLAKQHGYISVVRCKDCKHYIAPGSIHFDDGTTNLGACSIVRAYMVEITPDGFCAWGERKTENE